MITSEERSNIFAEMKYLLDEYDYDYSYDALNAIIDEWAIQKEPLIELFKKHPNYIEGKFMIAFDQDYEREIDVTVLNKFRNWLFNKLPAMQEAISNKLGMGLAYYMGLPYNIYTVLCMETVNTRTISEGIAEKINEDIPAIHAHAGQKTTRVINKICKYLGYDQLPEYNREFAKYADALSPIVIKRHTILSINPIDYLTMSFGNSWASCHTIDKENRRNMPNAYEGQYSSGTISYMLDPSSMVLYTVDASYEGNEYYNQPKINRQMFHWGEDKLVQSRLYPQSNDSNDEAYAPYRNLVQEIMSVILDVPNLWSLSRGYTEANKYIHTKGTHYADYAYYDNCTLSKLKGSENTNCFTVGAKPICIECGCRHDKFENINHCAAEITCDNCGESIHADDVYWVDGYAYCGDCVSYCPRCDTYHRGGEYYIASENRNVCEDCAHEHYIYCSYCGYYEAVDYSTYITSEDRYVCDECLNDHYIQCDKCGEWFRDSDIYGMGDNYYCECCRDEILEEGENEDE